MSRFEPWLTRDLTLPGTAITGLPCLAAQSAVISAPDFSPASTTRTPKESPEMIRFLAGKCHGKGSEPQGYSETSAPLLGISEKRRRFALG